MIPFPEAVFFKDLPNHHLHSVLPKISNCMVIHGEKDELVPVDQAWEIFQGLNGPKEIHVIESADHRLTEPNHRRRAMELTVGIVQEVSLMFRNPQCGLTSRTPQAPISPNGHLPTAPPRVNIETWIP